MKVLLVVDVQNDFLPEGSLAVANGYDILPAINRLIERFDLVVATQDWHPKDHSSFASNHAGKETFEEIELNDSKQTLWPDHCVQGSKGAEFAKTLNTEAFEAIFRKGIDTEIDSYSGFYDNNHRKSTGLADYLRGKDVSQVFVTGLAGDICVYFTVLDSLSEGFETTLVADATMPLDTDTFDEKIAEMKKRGAKVAKESEL